MLSYFFRYRFITCQAPVAEEFLFRGCMLPFLVPHFGEDMAVKICPLFFSVGECCMQPAADI